MFWSKASFYLKTKTNNSSNETFSVDCSIDQVQLYDKNRGYDYFFTLKAYNRARLFVIVKSTKFFVHSSLTPSDGRIWHVNPWPLFSTKGLTEIFWQTSSEVMCGAWTGFTHNIEHVHISIGIGRSRQSDDIYRMAPIYSKGNFCISNLQLINFEKYFFIIQATTSEGTVSSSSFGIIVANESTALKNAKVNDANDCLAKNGKLIAGNFTLEPEKNYTVVVDNEKYYQDLVNVRLEIESKSNDPTFIPLMFCFHLSEEVPMSTWQFMKNKTFLYFQMYLIQNSNNITFQSDSDIIPIKAVTLFHCGSQRSFQLSANTMLASWTFNPQLAQYVSHYQIQITEMLCPTSETHSCTKEGIVLITSIAGTENKAKETNMQLKDGYTYQLNVEPCIATTCFPETLSDGVTIILGKIESGQIEAQLHKTKKSTQLFQLTAKWDAFVDKLSSGKNVFVYRYDWSLATEENAASLVTPWLPLYSKEVYIFTVINKLGS